MSLVPAAPQSSAAFPSSMAVRALLGASTLLLSHPVMAQDAGSSAGNRATIAQKPIVQNAAELPARTFTPADFERFAPRTALDMVLQIPGFSIAGGNHGNRGLGQATQNVLINGQRVSGKSNDAATSLSRIDAASVIRIELLDGASLDIPGLTGQVANIVYSAKSLGGTFVWRPQLRPRLDDNWFAGSVSLSGKAGATDWSLSAANNAQRQGHWGPENLRAPDGTLILVREEFASYYGDRPRLAASLSRTADNGAILNLNAAGGLSYFTRRVEGDVSTPTDERSRELFVGTEKEWNAELGGDYELALGAGRLKLIALARNEHSPLVNAFTARDLALDAVGRGNRFVQTIDEGERIARGEYRWKADGGDWQLSLEGAYNTLDSDATLFVRNASGAEVERPLPGASARVTEKRGEAIVSHSRALTDALAAQVNFGGEYSVIAVSGANGTSRSFVRPKGSVSLAWTVDPTLKVNSKVERRVDQLNFTDFLASVDVTNNIDRSNNPELVPPLRWRVELDATKQLGKWGSVKPFARFELVDGVVDAIPLSPTEEALGNLADPAVIRVAGIDGTLMFDPLGWRGAKLDFSGQYIDARVEDPLTGERRRVSGERIYALNANLRHDIPGSSWAWGAGIEAFDQSASVRLNQITRSSRTRPFTSLFIENKDVLGLTARATASNLLDTHDIFERIAFVGRRTGPIAFTEGNKRRSGRTWSFSISGKF